MSVFDPFIAFVLGAALGSAVTFGAGKLKAYLGSRK